MNEWLAYLAADHTPGATRAEKGSTRLTVQTSEGGASICFKDHANVTEVVYQLVELARVLEEAAIKRGASHQPMLADWPTSAPMYQAVAHYETVYVGPIRGLAIESLYYKQTPHVLLTWQNGKIAGQVKLA